MRKITVNFIIDMVSLIDLVCLVCTGIILEYVLPPGSGGLGRELHEGRGREPVKDFLSMTRHEWGDIHFYLALAFIAMMVLHIVMHWGWIKAYFRNTFGRG